MSGKMKIDLRNMKISWKIYALVAMLLMVTMGTAGFGIYQMQVIGEEIKEVAEQDIPLTETVTKITLHQLEQAVLFERGLAIGEELASDPSQLGHFQEVVGKFIKLGHKVAKELKEAEVVVAEALKSAHTEEARKEFTELLAALTKVDAEHEDYEALAEQAFIFMGKGEMLHPGEVATKIEAEEDQIDAELEEALVQLEKFTEDSLLTVQEHEQDGIRLLVIITVISIIVGLVLAILISRSVTKPIDRLIGVMSSLADGNLEIDIEGADRGDEIGKMSGAVQVFKDSAIERVRLEEEQKEAEKRAVEEKKAMMNKMADDFEASVGGVVETVSSAATEMESSAQAMTATAEQTSTQATAVAAAAEEATTNVQTVAAAAEELTSSISEISRQVSQSSDIAAQAVADAQATNEKIQGLAQAANKIGEVVALITDIADQTNLLALNATIEAARAGDAGKGFAVVASEVKNLANQTAKATEEISAQIGGIQGATQDSVQAIQAIGKTIGEISEIATTVASAVEEQGAATQEIARNVEQAASGTQEVSSNIIQVTQAAGETGQAAGQIVGAAGQLSKESETLRAEVDKFLAEVRAG